MHNSLFPDLNHLCTTPATIIQYRRGPATVPASIPNHPGHECAKPRAGWLALIRGNLVIQQEMRTMTSEVTKDLKFVVEITHPMAPNLNVIDLPGLLTVGD
jgi:hypothetical protein